MNTSQLAALRWMMERELSALRSPRMSPEISLKCPDENELASRLSERAVDERLTARRVERIRDLENALRRIEVMDYGVCEACGEPIPLLRLLASPSVRYCVACQQELEEEERAVVVTGSFDAPRPRRTMPPRPVTPPMPFFPAQTGKPLIRAGSMAFFEEVWAKSVDCGFTRGRGICPSSVGKEGESVKWRLPRVHRGSGLARLSRRPKTDYCR